MAHQMRTNGRNDKRNDNRARQGFNKVQDDIFDSYFTRERVNAGLLSCTVLKGLLRVNPSNRKVAYVSCEGVSIDICVDDDKLRNRAFHEDLVALQLLPNSQWIPVTKKPMPICPVDVDESSALEKERDILIQKGLWQVQESLLVPRIEVPKNEGTVVPNGILAEIGEYCRKHQVQPRGRVVYILESTHKTSHIGSLVAQCPLQEGCRLPESERIVFFKPVDNKYPDFVVQRINLPPAYEGNPLSQRNQIYQAEIAEPWSSKSKSPLGINVRSIGEMGCIHDETEALLGSFGINHKVHSEEMLQPLRDMLFQGQPSGTSPAREEEKFNWTIPASEIAKRRDLRSHRIFTIDPYNAKDLDDALHVSALSDGTFEIGVHIADVSYFLKEGTLLDLEARKRATSIYLVQKVIPMLPSILCEQLCSLNPNVDRLAYSCIFRMKADGNLVNEPAYFGRTVIRSCAKLDYSTAQRMIEGLIPSCPSPGPNPDAFLASMSEEVWESRRRPIGHRAWTCSRDVCMMNSIAQARRVVRQTNGALVMGKPKMHFSLDDEGNPTSASDYPIRESNQLVEEYMLLANYLVAQETLSRNGACAILRQHSPPELDRLIRMKALANDVGVTLDTSSAKKMQESCLSLNRQGDPALNSTIGLMLMETLNAASYIVAGDKEPDEWAHYALGIPYYTHFTSPIRRYADVMVHRLLDLGLRDEEAARADNRREYYKSVTDHCNTMRDSSRHAQEKSDALFLSVYLQRHPMYVDGAIVGLGPKSFQVCVKCLGEKYKLFVDDMPGVQHMFDESSQLLTLTVSRAQTDAIDPNRRNARPIFTHPNVLSFTQIKLTVTTPVVVFLTAKTDGCISTRCSLVCAGTCASNGFNVANFQGPSPPKAAATAVNASNPPHSGVDNLINSLTKTQLN